MHGISQARILECVAISFSRGSAWLGDGTYVSCVDRWILRHWPPGKSWDFGLNMLTFPEAGALNRTGRRNLGWLRSGSGCGLHSPSWPAEGGEPPLFPGRNLVFCPQAGSRTQMAGIRSPQDRPVLWSRVHPGRKTWGNWGVSAKAAFLGLRAGEREEVGMPIPSTGKKLGEKNLTLS